MQDALGVGRRHAAGDLGAVVEGRLQRQAAAADPLPEGLALVARHDDEDGAVAGLADLVDGADVVVVQGGGRAGLGEEALANEQTKSSGTKTWRFKAENVRDFAWSSSRKFIWDAMIHRQDDDEMPEVLAMSFYPPEAEPIWSTYSTHAVAHTMEVYNRFAFN